MTDTATITDASATPEQDGIVRPPEVALAAFGASCGFAAGSPHLLAALTHTSAAGGNVTRSNERLEFLGDALLSAIVARYLLAALPDTTDEGTLSRARVAVIRKETLAEAARSLGVSDVLIVGNGERRANRHTHDGLLADAYEALVGALFLEAGDDAVERFVRMTLAEPLERVAAAPPAPDPKTALQMRFQSQGRGLPIYRLIAEEGLGHEHTFVVEVTTAEGMSLGRGSGTNKRTAETNAARLALEALERDGGESPAVAGDTGPR